MLNSRIIVIAITLLSGEAYAQQATSQTTPREPWRCGLIEVASVPVEAGFAPGPYEVDLSGGTGSGAKAKIIVSAIGRIADMAFINQGGWYSVGDRLTAKLGQSHTEFYTVVVSTRDVHPVHYTTTKIKIINKTAGINPCPHEQLAIDPASSMQRLEATGVVK